MPMRAFSEPLPDGRGLVSSVVVHKRDGHRDHRTGIYGYPRLEKACSEAVDVCSAMAERLDIRIKLVAFDRKTAACLRRHFGEDCKLKRKPLDLLTIRVR